MAQEVTSLSNADEARFQAWVRANRITDIDAPQSHYDYRGYWKEFGNKPIRFGIDHFPDTYKQHGHPTFSVESKYSKGPNDGGRWEGETFIPPEKMPRLVKDPTGKVHSFPDDATDAEISTALNAIPETSKPSESSKARTWTDVAVDALPAIGGTIGGLAGASTGLGTFGLTGVPGAIAIGGIGGAAGEALKQTINRLRGAEVPTSSTEAARDIAKSGAIQGAIEGVTGGVGSGMQALAKPLMRSALGNTAATLARKPDLADVALKSGATVTRQGIHKLDDILATRSGIADRKALTATRNAIAEAWKQLSPEKARTLFGATAGNPAFRSAMAQGLYHSAGLFSGLTPLAIRSALLAQHELDQP